MAAAQVSVSTSAQSSVSSTEKRHRKFATPANANNRVGVFWSPEEEANLKREFLAGKSLDELSQTHQRAIRAIELRLAKIAADEVTESNSPTAACVKYRVTETMVQRELAKKVKKAQPKPAPVKKADLLARLTLLEEQVRQLTAQVQQGRSS